MNKQEIRQAAVDYAGNREFGAVHGYPGYTANLIEKGFVEGVKFAEKRMYSEDEVINMLYRYTAYIEGRFSKSLLSIVPLDWYKLNKKHKI